jgi:tetratricopeptide (TPR) repeat protein
MSFLFSCCSSKPPAIRDSLVPLCGVSQNYLASLVASHQAEDWDVARFCNQVIKPLSSDVSLAEHLLSQEDTRQFVKPLADVFISYAWTYKVGALLACLETKEDRHIWLDCVVVNQHTSSQVDHAQWLETFSQALKTIGKAELVMMPWNKPVPVTRAWCVFEQFVITSQNIPFETKLLPSDRGELVASLRAGKLSFADLLGLFASIDCEKASAFKREDREQIIGLLRSKEAVKRTNDATMVTVKKFLLDVALGEASGGDGTAPKSALESCHVLYALASVHDALGDWDSALPWYQKSLQATRDLQDESNPDLTSSMNGLGACLVKLSRYDEAEPVFQEALKLKLKFLGPDHVDSITGRDWLARIKFEREEYASACELFEQVVQDRRRVQGVGHADTGNSLNNLASVYDRLGRTALALATYEEALEIQKKSVGNTHPQLAITLNNIATCLDKTPDRRQEAVAMYEHAIDIQRKTLGDTHPSVAIGMHNLAMTLVDLGDVERGKQMGKAATEIMERAVGKKHANSIMMREVWG